MSCWGKKSISLYAEEKLIETEEIEIQCGIFEADSQSPLLFCNSFIPLTEQLTKLNRGYGEHNKDKILN
jgi:hypothetical protein